MLRAAIEEELEASARIVRDGQEIVPRFRVLAPDGEHTIFVQLPDEEIARVERLQIVRAFLIWKAATGFVQSSELVEPNAIASVAVTRDGVLGALRRMRRRPLAFAEREWFGREAVGDEIVSMLPPRVLTLTQSDLQFIDKAFGAGDVPGIRWVRPVET